MKTTVLTILGAMVGGLAWVWISGEFYIDPRNDLTSAYGVPSIWRLALLMFALLGGVVGKFVAGHGKD